MENKKPMGGKRRGAGRKPVLHKKKQVSLYVEVDKMIKFGGEDKMKEKLYSFINGELKEVPVYVTPTPDSFDAEKMDKINHDEHGQWQEPKSTITGLPPKISDFDKFMAELKNAKIIPQVEDIMKRAKAGIMFPQQLRGLEEKAKELSREMFND